MMISLEAGRQENYDQAYLAKRAKEMLQPPRKAVFLRANSLQEKLFS
jgi:hypothetical protein